VNGDPPTDNTTIPRSFRWATTEAPELRARVGREPAITEGLAALSSPGLLLVGPSGCGKTSLACALLREWEVRHPRRRAVFVPAWKLGVARAQHGLGRGEAPDVDRAMEARLLLLDDVGSERNTATNAVPDVIFARAVDGRPTWVTTWMTAEAVTQRYGDGIARRLFEAGRVTVIACGKQS
jgi:DNA replication protein DnaC